jgi:hypothetical protein
LETIWDWVTVAIFAGLIVLYLQRSTQEEPKDTIWQYLPPSVGCAVANYLGNDVNPIAAAAVVAATLAYIYFVLKPLDTQAPKR